MIRLAIAGLWLAWLAFWIAQAGNAKADHRRETAASRLGHLLPLGVAIVLLAAPLPLPRSWAYAWLGMALTAAGLAFACWARVHIGRNWSAVVTVKQDHVLVQSGPYRIVRHPIYTGLLLAFLGTAIARGDWRGLLAVALGLVSFLRKIRLEERWMAEQFPRDYPEYRAKVAALIPFLV